MATKKQKRQAAAEKHERFMATYRAEGLTAQKWDRDRRARRAEKLKQEEVAKTKKEATAEALAKLLPKEPAA